MDRQIPELLSRAASLLTREAARLPSPFSTGAVPQLPGSDSALKNIPFAAAPQGRTCPYSGAVLPGAALPGAALPPIDLRKQAHELVESLVGAGAVSPGAGYAGLPGQHGAAEPMNWLGKLCPITGAAPQLPGFDRDQLRRQAHQFVETLLVTFNEATGEKGLPAEDQVPLLYAQSPVQPGEVAKTSLRIANEESIPSEVSLYCTNFVADCGYEIPSLRVTVSPRRLTIPAHGEASFEVSVAVPQQTPRGKYAGLIQAMGYTYFKTVFCIEVL